MNKYDIILNDEALEMIANQAAGRVEEAKEWRVITAATPFVEHFITHVIFVREEVITKRPQAVRSFLQAGSTPSPS